MTVNWKEKWILVAPAILVIALVLIFPFVYSIGTSLTSRSLLHPQVGSPFVGLKNYIDLAGDEVGHAALSNNLYFAFVGIPIQLVLGMVFAMLLNNRIPGIQVFRILLTIPMIIAPLITAFCWLMIFQPSLSPVKAMLTMAKLNWEMPALLGSVKTVMPALTTVSTWAATPFVMLVLLAALQSLPREPFEAAVIDGASRWQTIMYLTLPMIRPVIVLIVMMRIMDTMRAFEVSYLITGGGPGYSSELISTFNYDALFTSFKVGYTSAISVTALVLVLLLCLALNRLSKADAT